MKKNYLILILLISSRLLSQVNLTGSLVACYPLNANATEPINNLTGTLSAATPTADRFGNPSSACFFNGTANSNIVLPDNVLLKAPQVSFSGWVKFASLNPQFIAFVYNGCVSYQEGYQLAANSQQFQIATAEGACGSQVILNSTVAPVANTWYHVGFYAGPDSLKLYVNGNLAGAAANTHQLAYGQATHVYLGGSVGATINLPMHGSMDNVRFYNRKLNNAEFNQLYTQDPACTPAGVGIGENESDKYLIAHPNPSNGLFSVTNKYGNEINCKILNMYGHIIRESKIDPESSATIDLGALPDEIYFIRFRSDETFKTIKIVKSKIAN